MPARRTQTGSPSRTCRPATIEPTWRGRDARRDQRHLRKVARVRGAARGQPQYRRCSPRSRWPRRHGRRPPALGDGAGDEYGPALKEWSTATSRWSVPGGLRQPLPGVREGPSASVRAALFASRRYRLNNVAVLRQMATLQRDAAPRSSPQQTFTEIGEVLEQADQASSAPGSPAGALEAGCSTSIARSGGSCGPPAEPRAADQAKRTGGLYEPVLARSRAGVYREALETPRTPRHAPTPGASGDAAAVTTARAHRRPQTDPGWSTRGCPAVVEIDSAPRDRAEGLARCCTGARAAQPSTPSMSPRIEEEDRGARRPREVQDLDRAIDACRGHQHPASPTRAGDRARPTGSASTSRQLDEKPECPVQELRWRAADVLGAAADPLTGDRAARIRKASRAPCAKPWPFGSTTSRGAGRRAAPARDEVVPPLTSTSAMQARPAGDAPRGNTGRRTRSARRALPTSSRTRAHQAPGHRSYRAGDLQPGLLGALAVHQKAPEQARRRAANAHSCPPGQGQAAINTLQARPQPTATRARRDGGCP